ncbi:endolytic transglycosylase MltG [Bacillus taeanensis]|uniref:Endolytic murein transglycosylase n=1 Tax=Bacillus taeanensis TaxID=273032 RepID=A0A366Y4T8_9BACI|nr:endolytic transglycosylase MltG [Bacillus taeanensis]RBW71433.1 endolytic transglycosylase MltG [Bacillus taeanensis]
MKQNYHLIIAAAVIVVGMSLFLWQENHPSIKEQSFIIMPGDPLVKTAERLEKAGIITSAKSFLAYGKWNGLDRTVQPGEHVLNNKKTYEEIYTILKTVKVKENGIAVTFPEGFYARQMGDVLEKKGIVNKKEFLEVVRTGRGLDHVLLKDIPNQSQLKYRLEGYLFPDTYYFKKNTPPEEVVQKMLLRFYEQMEQLSLPTHMTVSEWVTLASIVEREASLQEEMPIIAGVFQNRLKRDIKLQSDVTVQYILEKRKKRVLYKDLEINDPYNTYKNKGMPPGPVSNPGAAALKAAANSSEHNYIYFVAKADNSGAHHFSETYEEHLRYSKQYQSQF